MIVWFEAHDNLSGWAQFAGAMLALLVTYLTAFWPIWRRKRQLRNAASRLLSNAYEAIESYSRTSEYNDLLPLPVRHAALTMGMVADEMRRFPIYELDDQGSNSLARRMVAMSQVLSGMRLALDTMAAELDMRSMREGDREDLRHILKIALKNAEALLVGRALARPEP